MKKESNKRPEWPRSTIVTMPRVAPSELLPSSMPPVVMPQYARYMSLNAIREMLDDKTAKFFTHQQRAEVEAVILTNRDVVAILAIGGGN